MKILPLILLLALIAFIHPACAADPSPEMQQILKERMQGQHDLKVNGLKGAAPTPEQNKRLKDKAIFEAYHVPTPKRGADYFSYSVYRFNATGEVWIMRSGGFAGRTMLYIVAEQKKADKEAEPKPPQLK